MKVWIDGRDRGRRAKRGSRCSITASSTATACSRASASTAARVPARATTSTRLEIGARCDRPRAAGRPRRRSARSSLATAARARPRATRTCASWSRAAIGALGVDPTTLSRAVRLLHRRPDPHLSPRRSSQRRLDLITSSCGAPALDVLDPRVKSLNYLNNALAKHEARRQGADEALLLNAAGAVAEASVANVFAVRGGALAHAARRRDGALEGITRASVLELAARLGVPGRGALARALRPARRRRGVPHRHRRDGRAGARRSTARDRRRRARPAHAPADRRVHRARPPADPDRRLRRGAGAGAALGGAVDRRLERARPRRRAGALRATSRSRARAPRRARCRDVHG